MSFDFEKISDDLTNNIYPLIGSGSGRQVYDLKHGYALKVAMNRKGIAQNMVEKQIASSDPPMIFAKVFAASEDNKYLVMEKAERISTMSVVWNYFKVRNSRELFHMDLFKDLPAQYGLLYVDLNRPSNWGMVKDKPVIVDYGFTRDVKRKFYSLF